MHRSGNYILQPTGYRAFIPSPLPPSPPISMSEELILQLSEADIALGGLDMMGHLLPNVDHIIAMYVRKEALLSSQIEGTQASLEDIFEYESAAPLENLHDVEEVVNYIKAMNYGLERLREFPMSIRVIKEIHAILLTGTRGQEKTPGEFKRSQNWIGPAGGGLKQASFVPPPPLEALEAMGQLELYLHRENAVPVLVNCALIHYQFETIHPFLDGNGRLGRLLITFYLCWKRVMVKPLLYLSYYFKLHRQEYYDRLDAVRAHGNYEQWIGFFLRGITWTSKSVLETTKQVLKLADTNKRLLLDRRLSTPLAMALLDYLTVKPLVSIQEIADHLQAAYTTVSPLVNQFVDLGILKEMTGKKRDRRFLYWEYMDCLAEGTNP
ncbi:MAG: Fic family protein [Chlamydiia bacterium]